MTIADIITENNSAIRAKTTAGSILKGNVADQLDDITQEHRLRGIHIAANTAALANILGTETDKVWVPGTGLFQFNAAGSANGITSFAAMTTGTWDLKGVTEMYHSNRKIFHVDKAVTSGIVFDEGGAFDTNFLMHQSINVNGGVHAIDFRNLNAGSAAGLGLAFRNDGGAFLQIQKGSAAYNFMPNGTLIRDSGGGFSFVTPGTFNFGSSTTLASAYFVLDATNANFKTQNILTIQPSGNGAGAWRLGKAIGADGVGAATFIEFAVDGTVYIMTVKAKT